MLARVIAVTGLAGLAALAAGCATTAPARPSPSLLSEPAPLRRATDPAPAQLCALDALRWSHGFVPRATAQECVTILDSVTIGN